MKPVLILIGFASIASSAGAQGLETFTGAGGAIQDDGDTRFSIFVNHIGNPHYMNSISLDMSHTWAGDLYIEVRHKTVNDYAIVLLDRPGVPQSQFGNSDDLDGVYTFRDGFAPIPETAGATGLIPPGTYGPHAGQTIDSGGFESFGEWSVFISDRAGGDTGVLRSWTLEMYFVPTPGTAAILGVGAVIAGRRRR